MNKMKGVFLLGFLAFVATLSKSNAGLLDDLEEYLKRVQAGEEEDLNRDQEVEGPQSGDILIARYSFKAETERELNFKKGDMITFIRQVDKNWLEGEIHGQIGIFLRTYVEFV